MALFTGVEAKKNFLRNWIITEELFLPVLLGYKYTGKLLVKFNYSRNILILLNFSTQQNSSVPGGDK